jgi:hypothetical protein
MLPHVIKRESQPAPPAPIQRYLEFLKRALAAPKTKMRSQGKLLPPRPEQFKNFQHEIDFFKIEPVLTVPLPRNLTRLDKKKEAF